MSYLLSIAWRNIWRNGRRTWITATAMAVSVAMCIFLSAFTNGFYSIMFDLMVTQKIGHIQIQHPEYAKKKSLHDTISDGDTLIQSIRDLKSVQSVSAKLTSSLLVSGKEDSAGAQVIGVFPEFERVERRAETQIVDGEYLGDSENKEVIVGNSLQKDLKLTIGEELFIYTQASDGSMAYDLYKIVGVYKTGSTGLDKGIQVHIRDLQDLLILPEQFHEISVVDDNIDHIEQLREEITGLVSTSSTIQSKTWWETSPQTQEMMKFQDVTMYIFLGIIFFIAGFGILNTMLMAVFERTREIGVMKALGMRANKIIQVIVIESIFLAFLASCIGFLLGVLSNLYLKFQGVDMSGGSGEPISMMGMNFDPVMYTDMQWASYPPPIIGLFVVALLSSLWPAYRASRLNPVEAIRSE